MVDANYENALFRSQWSRGAPSESIEEFGGSDGMGNKRGKEQQPEENQNNRRREKQPEENQINDRREQQPEENRSNLRREQQPQQNQNNQRREQQPQQNQNSQRTVSDFIAKSLNIRNAVFVKSIIILQQPIALVNQPSAKCSEFLPTGECSVATDAQRTPATAENETNADNSRASGLLKTNETLATSENATTAEQSKPTEISPSLKATPIDAPKETYAQELSKAAEDALLKSLLEPPPKVASSKEDSSKKTLSTEGIYQLNICLI